MPFSFAHPVAEWLLPAVALPVIFHLFFRLRRQVREFPSLMLFLRIDPRLSAKRKIHEWLILFLRCLFLALVILALARPLLGLLGSNEHITRLILIDNSGSMAASATAGVSKLTLAERAAEKLIDATRSGDSVAVRLMISDPTVTLPSGFDATPAALRDAISKLAPTDGAAPVAKAIRAALATLGTAKTTQRELDIITDLQRGNWSRGDMGAETPAPGGHIVIYRTESAPLNTGSVSAEAQDVPARAIPVGRIVPVRVTLQNHGPATAHVRLNSIDDSGKNVSRDMEVSAGASTPVTLTFSFTNPGFHWARVWVEGDAAPAADRANIGFWCTDVAKALFVGAKADFAALPYAVSPGGNANLSGIVADFIDPTQLTASLAAKPLVVALTWDHFPQDGAASQALQNYVRGGGTLLLVPQPDEGNSVVAPVASWLNVSLGAAQTFNPAQPIMLLQGGDPLWRGLRDADGQPQLGLLRVFQYRPIQAGTGWQTLAASGQGATLLARRDFEQGRVYASGIAFSSKWSSLPLKAAFVVLAQNLVFGDQAENIPVQGITAGDDVRFDFPAARATVKSLAGSALDWQGEARDFAGFPRAGVYEIAQHEHVGWAAVSGNVGQANHDFLPLGPVPLLRNVPHEVVALVRPEDLTRAALAQRSGASLFRWLLLAALIVLLLETWLANERSFDLGKRLFGASGLSETKQKAVPKKRAEAVKR